MTQIKYTIVFCFIFSIKISFSNNFENLSSKSDKFLSDKSFLEKIYSKDSAIDFDSYVFAIQLPIVHCFKFPNCFEKLVKIPKNTFTIHGLWPNLKGKSKEDCNIGERIDVEFTDEKVEHLAKRYWKSLKDDDKSFWEHEFNKHGYCWNLKYEKTYPEQYFKFVLELYLNLGFEKIIHEVFGIDDKNKTQEFSYENLMEKFTPIIKMNFDLKCLFHEGKQYLSDVFINLDLNLNSLPGKIGSNCNKTELINIIFQ